MTNMNHSDYYVRITSLLHDRYDVLFGSIYFLGNSQNDSYESWNRIKNIQLHMMTPVSSFTYYETWRNDYVISKLLRNHYVIVVITHMQSVMDYESYYENVLIIVFRTRSSWSKIFQSRFTAWLQFEPQLNLYFSESW